jgi:hypothetical protein
MNMALNRSKITYLPLDEATEEPGDGFWQILADRWWSYEPGKGLLFYGKSAQCNSHESISRKITATHHPDAEVLFVPRVYLRHDCRDYI